MEANENIVETKIEENNGNSRIHYLDQLKALAIMGIVATHISAGYAVSTGIFTTPLWIINISINSLQGIFIPIFVMISGALLIDRKYSLATFFKKRFMRVVIPFIFWALIFIVFALCLFNQGIDIGHYSFLSWDFVYDVFFAKIQGFSEIFWFIWMLIFIYLTFPIWDKIGHSLKPKYIFLILGLWMFTCLLDTFNLLIPLVNLLSSEFNQLISYLSAGGYLNFISSFNQILGFIPNSGAVINQIHAFIGFINYNFNIIQFISFSFYALCGYCLANYDFLNNKHIKKFNFSSKDFSAINAFWFLSAFLLYILFRIYFSFVFGKLGVISFFNILTIIMVIACFLSFRYFGEYFENQGKGNFSKKLYDFLTGKYLGSFIESVSKSSYGIYLVHILLIIIANVYFAEILEFLKYNILANVLFNLFVILSISWFIIFILSHIPGLKKLVGSE